VRFLIIGGLIALVAFVGGGEVLGRKLPGPFQYLSRTGLGFLMLGMLMGPVGFDVFDHSESGLTLREALAPITALALAWIGMLYGSHLEWTRLKRFGAPLYRITLLEGALALLAVSLCAGALLWAWRPNLSIPASRPAIAGKSYRIKGKLVTVFDSAVNLIDDACENNKRAR